MSRLTADTTELLRRIGAGCVRARRDLIAHSCDRLRRIARRMLGQDFSRLLCLEETDDILHGAVLRLNQALTAAPPESSAHFWNLAAVQIRRELIDLVRHHFGPEGHAANHHTDPNGASEPSGPLAHSAGADGTEPSAPAEWAEFLGMAESLPKEEREVFDLYWVQDMTQEQVAAILDVSVRTVRRLWLAARLRLAKAIRSAGLWEGGRAVIEDERLVDLLLSLEEIHDQGGEVALEELCRDCPELLPTLREAIAALEGVSWLERRDDTRVIPIARSDTRSEGVPRLLAGRYRLEHLIGEGASALVWRAFDLKLQRPVAVKVPRQGRLLPPDQLDAFLAEARKVAQLRHVGIVPIHDVTRSKEGCFLVTDLVSGMDLRRQLLAGPLLVPAALRITADVAEALHHAHQQGFIHRDVKPGNILVDASGRGFIADFGIALSSEEMNQQDGRGAGTPRYMSPEQLSPDRVKVDHRTDIYSLGVVLYEALTGAAPFEAGTAGAGQGGALREAPRLPRSVNPAIPKQVERACLKCLARLPKDRYATAQEVADEMRRLLCKRAKERYWPPAFLGFVAALALVVATDTPTTFRDLHVENKRQARMVIFETDGVPNTGGPNSYTNRYNAMGVTVRDLEVKKGVACLWKKDYKAALQHLDAALAYRKSTTVFCAKADAHLGLQEYAQAVKACQAALRIEPDCAKARDTMRTASALMQGPKKR